MIGYDGKTMSYRNLNQTLKYFEGTCPFSELEIIPLNLLDNHEEEYGKLVSRGQKFWKLGGQHLKEYRHGLEAYSSSFVCLSISSIGRLVI